MRVRVDTYDAFKAKASAVPSTAVYYSWDAKGQPENPEAPLFFVRAMIDGVVLEFWDKAMPPTFVQDFPAAIAGEMEE